MVNVESMVPPVRVQVVLGRGPRDLQTWSLELPPGTPLSQALTACGLCAEPQAEDGTPLAVAIWGKARPLDTPLRDLDRVELLRPLRVDPKEARRQRYRKQPRAEQG